MRKTLFVPLILLLAAPAALAQQGKMVGKVAPEIRVSNWINRPERTTVAESRGHPLLLEFFATW